jgi:hypothetical protein
MKNEFNRRKKERKNLTTEVEFYVNADILQGVSINVSETGIQLDSEKPLEIELRYKKENKEYYKKAFLRWVKEQEDASCSFGFEFVNDETKNDALLG